MTKDNERKETQPDKNERERKSETKQKCLKNNIFLERKVVRKR